ncbi:MAG: hypothetical protein IT479_05135 [Xanthomonadales bacterium]|nr:hypothetical protein [Xanthomonadales bacterium]
MRVWLLALLLGPLTADAAQVLVVDLSEAYSRSSALAQLLREVDGELKAIAGRHRPALQALRNELQTLKASGAASRDKQWQVPRRIAAIEAAAEVDEDRLAAANQRAIARVDSAIAEAKEALRLEAGARAVLDIQETRYVRPGCGCLASDRLYELLNERLPKVELELQPPVQTSRMLHRSLPRFARPTHNRPVPA